MSIDTFAMSVAQIFEHLQKLLVSQQFLHKKGIGNEVPFFICPFNPKNAVDVERQIRVLKNHLANQGVQTLEINLYDLANGLLKQRDILQQIFSMEQDVSKEQLKELLQGVLDSEAHLIPEISKIMRENTFDILFITGIGEVFPYIRSHNVLNNLQSTAKDKPTVMFFPGEYTHSLVSGASLDLFGVLHDDKYYRAFNIFHCEA